MSVFTCTKTRSGHINTTRAQLSRALGGRLRYAFGHTHCNRAQKAGAGFMVGGYGMSDCGEWGLTLLDTTRDRAKVLHFRIADHTGVDRFHEVHTCLRTAGVSGCVEYADVWLNESLADLEGSLT